MGTATRYDKDTVLRHASGRWPDIMAALAAWPDSIMDGNGHPCPICRAGSDRFNVGADFAQTGTAFCRGCKLGGDGPNALQKSNGWTFAETLQRLGEYLNIPADEHSAPPRVTRGDVAEQCHHRAIEKEKLRPLAAELGVSIDALTRLRCGWNNETWTFPETDDAGKVVGINRRFPDGSKRHMKGHKRGLMIADEGTGTLYIVEGATDTATMIDSGCSVIARPSANGGGKLLQGYLTGQILTRDVVVVGERDKKETGIWPGLQGALSIARKLADSKHNIRIALPQEGSKDIRDWRRQHPDADLPASLQVLTIDEAAALMRDLSADSGQVELSLDEQSVNDEVVAELAKRGDIYDHIGTLSVVRPDDDRMVIHHLSLAGLREMISATCRFYVDGEEGPQYHRPPKWCYDAIAARGTWQGIPPIRGIVNCPVLRSDGSVLQTAGYDPDSGLYADLRERFPSIPDRPTTQDLTRSLDLLHDLVADFPFRDDVAKSAWFASLLTPLAREAYHGCTGPLFLFDANVRGSGKSLLADINSLIVTGRDATRLTAPRDDDEARKRITALVNDAERVVLIDNIAGRFGSASLDAALTGETWKDRRLGHTELIEAPLRMTWYASGNNVILAADTARRVCDIRLESPLEHPEDREGFKHPDIRRYVRQNRPALLAAALTILRGYIAEERPVKSLKPWGSFEGWSDLIRGTLTWCGLADPGETRLKLRETSDSEAGALRQMMTALQDIDPHGDGLKAGELIKIAQGRPAEHSGSSELADAIEAFTGQQISKVSSQRLGSRLSHFRGRVIGGQSLDYAVTRGTNYWFIKDA